MDISNPTPSDRRIYQSTLDISPPNTTPTAYAGPDQLSVGSGTTVTLDGSGSSDADSGDTLTYKWSQTGTPTVTLSDNNSTTADKPTFTAPTLNVGDANVTLTFSLVVNDGTVDSAADTVDVTVKAPTQTEAERITLSKSGQTINKDGNANAGDAAVDGGSNDLEFKVECNGECSIGVNNVVIIPTGGAQNASFKDWIQNFSWLDLIGIGKAIAVGEGDFTLNLGTLPYTITNGSPFTYTINFDPSAPGLRDGIVVITFSDGSEFRYTISGNGTTATLTSSSQPANIPVFGLPALIALLLGLFWFGNRRRKG
ncbi:MAG: hypothetical protein R3F02_19630 [Thiolinea sp.]